MTNSKAIKLVSEIIGNLLANGIKATMTISIKSTAVSLTMSSDDNIVETQKVFNVKVVAQTPSKLALIKMYKDVHGVGLKEAKDEVDEKECLVVLYNGLNEERANKIAEEAKAYGIQTKVDEFIVEVVN